MIELSQSWVHLFDSNTTNSFSCTGEGYRWCFPFTFGPVSPISDVVASSKLPFGIAKMAWKDGFLDWTVSPRICWINRQNEIWEALGDSKIVVQKIWQHIRGTTHLQHELWFNLLLASFFQPHGVSNRPIMDKRTEFRHIFIQFIKSILLRESAIQLYICHTQISHRLFSYMRIDVDFGCPSPPSQRTKELSHMDSETSVDDSEASSTSCLAGGGLQLHPLRGSESGATSCNW